eukprot:Rmarinus@m.22834
MCSLSNDLSMLQSRRTALHFAFANVRKRYWIERLQSWNPLGFNQEFSTRREKKRNRRRNPMKWRRAKNAAAADVLIVPASPSADTVSSTHVSDDNRGRKGLYRRAFHLIHASRCNRLHEIRMDTYHLESLRRIKYWIEDAMSKGDVQHEDFIHVEHVLKMIDNARTRLRRRIQKPKNKDVFSFYLPWVNDNISKIRLRDVFNRQDIRNKFPMPARDVFRHIRVVKKTNFPFRTQIFNYGIVARKLILPTLNNDSECLCHYYKQKFRSSQYNDCVFTGDLSIVSSTRLRWFLQLGPLHRFPKVDIDIVLSNLEEELDAFIKWTRNKTWDEAHLQLASFHDWKVAVLEVCNTRYSSGPDFNGYTLQLSDLHCLWKLQKLLVICPIDKANNNMVFICKRAYTQRLANELSTGSTYTNVPATMNCETVVNSHKMILSLWKIPVTKEALPYLYYTVKLHKNPVGQRFIAGSAACTTTMLSKFLTGILRLVFETLVTEDNAHILKHAIRRFFVVNGFEEAAEFLRRWKSNTPDHARKLLTFDFSTMYTNLPHDDLKDKVFTMIQLAAKYQFNDLQHTCVRYEKKDVTWRRESDPQNSRCDDVWIFTLDRVREMLYFLIDNTFLFNGGTLRHQQIGIPMGTNCAPYIANLYLAYYEREFISQLQEDDVEKAKNWHTLFRFIDDGLTLDIPDAESTIISEKKIYPVSLALSRTNDSDDETVFLGMKIKLAAGGKLRMTVWDRRVDFPFRVTLYPHFRSCLPTAIKRCVCIGLLHRYQRICSSDHNFLKWAVVLMTRLKVRGFSPRCLLSWFRQFLHKKGHLFSIDIPTMIDLAWRRLHCKDKNDEDDDLHAGP